MKKHCLLPLLLAAAVLLSGCQAAQATEEAGQTATVTLDDMFTDRDLEVGYDETTAAAITLSGSSASSDSDAVTIDGSTVTITDEGTYLLSGTLDDGMVIVDAEDTDKVQLVLDNASIHCTDCAALYVRQADKVFVTTAADSQNTLSAGETFTQLDDNNIDGAVFSKSDLTLNGLGTLTVDSPAGHGVVSKDDLAIASGTYVVTAAGQGLSGKDSVRIADGTFTLTTGKDAIQSDNEEDADKGFVYLAGGTFTITAEGDGLSASSWMQVDDATCTITTGGGSANGETHTSDAAPGGGMGGKGGRMPNADGSTQPPERPTGEMPQEGAEPPADPPQGAAPTDNAAASDAAAAPAADENQTSDASAASEDDTADTVSTKGFKAGTALTILGGSFTLDCADDAFHSNGDLTVSGGTANIQTGDDAFHADNALTVSDGEIEISTCYEGLEGLTVTVSGGDINVTASDDGVNAAGGADESGFGGNGQDQFAAEDGVSITITGGSLTVNAGGDGLDSNGDLTVSGGTVYISTKDGSADSALDYNGDAAITGGTLIGVGSSGMAQNFGDSSTQGAILLTVDAQAAGSTVSVCDSAGNVLASWDAPQAFSSVVISCPGLEADGTYTVTTGDASTEVTLDGLLYGSGGGMGHGGMGGTQGGRGEMPQSQTAASA